MDEQRIQSAAALSSAHTEFLAQLNDEQFWQLADQLAHHDFSEPMQDEEYLLCAFGPGHCLFPMAALCEIVVSKQHFSFLSAMPSWMLGLTAWRGQIVAAIDLGAYLLNSAAQPNAAGILITAQVDYLTLGFYVSAVQRSTTLNEERLTPPEENSIWYAPQRREALRGLYDDALVLDLPVIFTDITQQINNGGVL